MHGIFTISLDFELHWGVFDKKDRPSRRNCYLNTLKVIPRMLDMFSKYDVHVTWATVGSLFAKNEKEWRQMKPASEPVYSNQNYSPYKWAARNSLTPDYDYAHFAPEMIRNIANHPGQEIATHTFGHFYCLEDQSNPQAFEDDLKSAISAAELFGTKIISLVFPRNQFNAAYLKTCYEQGIRVVRSNPDNWYWTPVQNAGSGIIRKIARTADAYIGIGQPRTSYPLSSIRVIPGEPLQLPASRFLRPWRSKYKFANSLRLSRLKNELVSAAIHNECFHLWWHPENFGDYPEENLKSLEVLLREFKNCRNKYGMKSWNMCEYANNLCDKTSDHHFDYKNVNAATASI